MKTLVVFEVDGGLASLMLSELATVPGEGRSYFFDEQRYKVAESIEFLGVRSRTGVVLSGNEKLLSVLTSVYGDAARVAALLAGMKSIGAAGNSMGTTAGGLILPASKGAEDFDHVLFVRLKKTSTNAPALKLAKLTGSAPDAAALVDKPTSPRRRGAKSKRSKQ